MSAKKFAFYGGIIMFFIGLISLIPGLEGSSLDLPDLKVEVSYGRFLGLFPMNIFNKITLLIFGIAGIAAGRVTDSSYSIHYSRIVFFFMGTAAFFGFYNATNTLNDYWPLFSGDIIIHGVFAVIGGICGFIPSRSTKQQISI